MLLKVGELARRSGITVRTLHHYDNIGLLMPSARSGAGYRLYDRNDIARLHQIQVLSRLGLSLADVGAVLDRESVSLSDVIDKQLQALEREIDQSRLLCDRLHQMQRQFASGEEPDLDEWLKTLEMMTMYDKYFSPEEIRDLPVANLSPEGEQEWKDLVSEVRLLQESAVPVDAPEAMSLARRWMATAKRDTAENPIYLHKLNVMHENEPELQAEMGMSPELMEYILRAFSESKLAIYRKYLNDDEYAFTREHYFDRIQEWPPLIAAFREAMERGVPPQAAEARELGAKWLELFRSFAGDNPETQQKFRQAMHSEPELMEGTWLSPELMHYLRQSVEAAQQ